jgi:hypothetical protein
MTEQHNAGYEKKDIDLKKTFLYGSITIVILAVCVFVLDNYFDYVKETEYRRAVLEAPTIQLDTLNAREDSLLSTYELVDTADSKYRIPIEQAMELLVKEGDQNK